MSVFNNANAAPTGQAASGAETLVAGLNIPVEGTGSTSEPAPSTTNVGAEPQADSTGGTQENLILGKFKSHEELEKAYANLEKHQTKTAQELSQLRKNAVAPKGQATNAPVPTQQPQAQATSLDDVNAKFAEKFVNDPLGTLQQVVTGMLGQQIAPIQQQTQEHQLKLEMAAMGAKYPDFYALGDQVTQVYKENPDLWRIPNNLEIAYKMAKADYGANALKEAREAGRNEATKTLQQKQGLSVEGQLAKDGAGKTQLSPEDQLRAEILQARGTRLFRAVE